MLRFTPILVLAALLAGCTEGPKLVTTHLDVDFADQGQDLQLTIDANLASRPAQGLYASKGASNPAHYSALDQLAQAQREGRLTFNATYDARFGFYLNDINGVAPQGTYWALSVDGAMSEKGMGEVALRDGTRVTWTLTAFS
jgi:hypothetical protein